MTPTPEPVTTEALDPGQALGQLRQTAPLVHCITNYVAMNFAANVLLAAGASPAMVHAEEEAGTLAGVAGALTINIGTLSPQWHRGMCAAARAAGAAGTPWVLDPVAHFISPWRRDCTRALVDLGPAVIRGNASEIRALAGAESAGKGADSGDSVAEAQEAARTLARQTGAVVAVTGAEDFVTDGPRALRVTGGSALMPQVTAMGCALTALIGGYAASGAPLDAAAAALAHFKAAGSAAASGAAGPGSFAVAFLDALAATRPEALAGRIAPCA